jgi:ATP-binding cassette subfamily C exporter for protease/lipase
MFTRLRTSETSMTILRVCRRHIVYAALFSGLLNILLTAPMLYMLQVYDRVIPAQARLTLLLLSLVLLFSLATLTALEAIRSRLLVRASVRIDEALAGPIMRATLRLQHGSPRVLRQALRELDTLRQALTGATLPALLDLPWVPLYILIGFLLHFWIGMLTLGGVVAILGLAWYNERATQAPMQEANVAASRSYSMYDASLASADVIHALGIRDALVDRHLQDRVTMIALQTTAGMTSARLMAQSKLVRLALQSAALAVGALLAISAKISPGAVFASMFVVGRALSPIDQLVGSWRAMIQARGAIALLDGLFHTAPVPAQRTLLTAPAGRLSIDQLIVGPDPRQPILKSVGFAVNPGEIVAIVGSSGAGKSTLIRAIAGAEPVGEGTIRFDGADRNDWDADQLARHVGFMPQETILLAGTVGENISGFSRPGSDDALLVDEQTIRAAKLAGAHELILGLRGGYDHVIGMTGRGLSAGQAQRIALARALFRDPTYLLLDEPNASLDAEGDAQLIATLEQLKAGGTTILIAAHRLTMLSLVDKLLVLRDGRVAQYGSRDHVLGTIAPAMAAAPVLAAGGRAA